MDDNIFSTSRSLQEKVSIKIQDGILIINTLKMTMIVTAVLKSKRPKKGPIDQKQNKSCGSFQKRASRKHCLYRLTLYPHQILGWIEQKILRD